MIMKTIFMGTPDFAVPTLDALVKAGHEVTAVVTQPDKAVGRSKTLRPSPVKKRALELGIQVLQPERARDTEFIGQIKDLAPDVMVVVAFGQILPKELLDVPPNGCVNVHASLLPKYRGAAPIQQAVINGDEVSGVTTMLMGEGLDTGDILLTKEVRLEKKETGGSLFEKLSIVGAELLIETLEGLGKNEIIPVPQDESKASYVKMLTKASGLITFEKSPDETECLIRGLDPWPGAYTYFNGKKLSVWDADVGQAKSAGSDPGTVTEASKDHISVICGDGILDIKEVQLEGKKRMKVSDFLNGCRMSPGDILGR